MPPDKKTESFFYGWAIIPMVWLIHGATSPGQTYGVSLFYPSLMEELSLSRSALGTAYSLGTLIASIPMTYVGALMDRHGARKVLMVVVTLLSLACWGMSLVGNVIALGFSFFSLRLLGQGSMTLLASNTMAMWFDRVLGRVSGFSTVFFGFIISAVPALNLWMIENWSWRWAYRAWGIGIWVVLMPVLFFWFVDRPEDIGQQQDGGLGRKEIQRKKARQGQDPQWTLKQAMGTSAYWILALGTCLWAMISTGMMLNLTDVFADSGLEKVHTAWALAAFGIAMSLANISAGFMIDYVAPRLIMIPALIIFSAACVLLRDLPGPSSAYTFGALWGAFQGLFNAVNSTAWVRFYGRAHLGKIRGSLTTVMVASSSLGPFLMGIFRDWLGSYSEILLIFAMMPLALAVWSVWLKKPVKVS